MMPWKRWPYCCEQGNPTRCVYWVLMFCMQAFAASKALLFVGAIFSRGLRTIAGAYRFILVVCRAQRVHDLRLNVEKDADQHFFYMLCSGSSRIVWNPHGNAGV